MTAVETVKALLDLGSDTLHDPCNRIQFMCGEWPNNERPMGGMSRAALIDWAKRLDAAPPKVSQP